jgi:hypothetical protein
MTSDTAPNLATRQFRTPLWQRLLSLVGTILLAIVTLGMTAFAVLLFRKMGAVGLVILACALLMGALTEYVWRDLRGRWGLRVVLERDAVKLDLPANRSLIHRPKAEHLVVPYADIEALETRLEAYRSQGMAIMQRAYALRRRNNELIFLFEERALGTGLQSDFYTSILTDLVARAHCPVRDLGMVEGKGGALSVWGTRAEDWSAPSLPADRQRQLWARAAGTGSLVMSMFTLLWLLSMVRGL